MWAFHCKEKAVNRCKIPYSWMSDVSCLKCLVWSVRVHWFHVYPQLLEVENNFSYVCDWQTTVNFINVKKVCFAGYASGEVWDRWALDRDLACWSVLCSCTSLSCWLSYLRSCMAEEVCSFSEGRELFRGLFNISSKSVLLELLDNFFALLWNFVFFY